MTKARSRFIIPAGTALAVSKIQPESWQAHTTRVELTFERYEFFRFGYLTFRHDGYFIKVQCESVKGTWRR